MTERPTEAELQRRWAESRWPTPFLATADGERVRVISPGRWNHGPGPDFIGAQILDGAGRARRGDVELHLEARAWLQHGHDRDAAYQGLLLHIVEWSDSSERAAADPRIPSATGLPGGPTAGVDGGAPRLPCEGLAARVGSAALEAQLLRIARRRFERKARELAAISAPHGPGSEADRRCLIGAARALGQPRNAELSEHAMRAALAAAQQWRMVAPTVAPRLALPGGADSTGGGELQWRRGRGTLGAPDGLSRILRTLLRRWTADGLTPAAAFTQLAAAAPSAAAAELQIPGQLGRARALQLLADAVYPLANAWPRWLALPAARYQRTDALRARLSPGAGGSPPVGQSARPGFHWRHPHSQALLELERTRCRQGACRICPLAALARVNGR